MPPQTTTQSSRQSVSDIISKFKSANPSYVAPSSNDSSSTDWYSGVKSGAYRPAGIQKSESASEKNPIASEESSPNLLQKGLSSVFGPIATGAVRTGQAIAESGLSGLNKLSGGALDKLTPEGNLDAALSRSESEPTHVPIFNMNVKPIKEETSENVAGTALGTVGLGMGSAPLAGATLGAAGAMESNKGKGEIGLDAMVGALGGKILDVGLGKALPHILDAMAKYGTPIIEKLQQQLPDYAKPILDAVIKHGNQMVADADKTKFENDTDISPEGGKLDVQKSRDAAWQDIQPKATPSVKDAYGAEKAVSKQGLFTRAQLMPTNADSKVIDALQPLYENGRINPGMPIKDKLEVVSQEAARLHSDQKNFLADHDIAVPLEKTSAEDGLFTVLGNKSERAKLVFSKDPSASGAYDSAIDVFKRNLTTGKSAGTTKNATSLTKIDEALTAFDNEMDKFGAWDRLKTGQLSETDKARIAAIRDIHTIARDYIADHLPPNNPWKSTRLNESSLYEAAGRMSPNLGNTVGESQWSQFWKDHPSLKQGALWALPTGLATIGGEHLLSQ